MNIQPSDGSFGSVRQALDALAQGDGDLRSRLRAASPAILQAREAELPPSVRNAWSELMRLLQAPCEAAPGAIPPSALEAMGAEEARLCALLIEEIFEGCVAARGGRFSRPRARRPDAN